MSQKMSNLTVIEAIDAILKGYHVTYEPRGEDKTYWYELRGNRIVWLSAYAKPVAAEFDTSTRYYIIGPPEKMPQPEKTKIVKPISHGKELSFSGAWAAYDRTLHEVYERGFEDCWKDVKGQLGFISDS